MFNPSRTRKIPNPKHQITNKSQISISNDQNNLTCTEHFSGKLIRFGPCDLGLKAIIPAEGNRFEF
jgi:hypothetical protein